MMTVAEAEMMRQASDKARSASFCVPPDQQQQHLSVASARDGDSAGRQSSSSQQDLESYDQQQQQNHQQEGGDQNGGCSSSQLAMPSATSRLMHDALQASESCGSGNNSPKARLKAAQASRRSQSCRVPGSKNASRPHVRRRIGTAGEDLSAPGSGTSSSANLNNQQEQGGEGDSYNPFLRKVPSCGRLLGPEDCMYVQDDPFTDESPVALRRSASARRPTTRHAGYSDSPVDHSPTPPRHPKQQHKARGGTGSSRKGPSGSSRKGGGLLEVRDPNENNDTLDTDQYLLRNFATTHKGSIINRGDSFRRRRSRSNSIQPPTDLALLPQQPQHKQSVPSQASNSFSPQAHSVQHQQQQLSPGLDEASSAAQTPDDDGDEEVTTCAHAGSFRVPILGAPGVGKTALIHQFRTSECINAYDCPAPSDTDDKESTVSIVLNSYESDIIFVNVTSAEDFQEETTVEIGGWVVVYSITDKSSFQRASETLTKLQTMGLLRGRAVILVANKCELVRSRAVGVDDGRDLACSYGAKFMEISVGMNHRCDELLVGILHQLRLKEEACPSDRSEKTPWTRNRSLMRASMKAKRLIHRVMGKNDSKYKSCEDFNN